MISWAFLTCFNDVVYGISEHHWLVKYQQILVWKKVCYFEVGGEHSWIYNWNYWYVILYELFSWCTKYFLSCWLSRGCWQRSAALPPAVEGKKGAKVFDSSHIQPKTFKNFATGANQKTPKNALKSGRARFIEWIRKWDDFHYKLQNCTTLLPRNPTCLCLVKRRWTMLKPEAERCGRTCVICVIIAIFLVYRITS